jgi:hypothetical protein
MRPPSLGAGAAPIGAVDVVTISTITFTWSSAARRPDDRRSPPPRHRAHLLRARLCDPTDQPAGEGRRRPQSEAGSHRRTHHPLSTSPRQQAAATTRAIPRGIGRTAATPQRVRRPLLAGPDLAPARSSPRKGTPRRRHPRRPVLRRSRARLPHRLDELGRRPARHGPAVLHPSPAPGPGSRP